MQGLLKHPLHPEVLDVVEHDAAVALVQGLAAPLARFLDDEGGEQGEQTHQQGAERFEARGSEPPDDGDDKAQDGDDP